MGEVQIYDGENLLEIDPHPVQAIDTVGAGDMYAGAFLYGIIPFFKKYVILGKGIVCVVKRQ